MPTLDGLNLTTADLDLLITHCLHWQSHVIREGWEAVDATAARTRDWLTQQIMDNAADLTRLDVWLSLTDMSHPCAVHQYDPPPAIVHGDDLAHITVEIHRHHDGGHGSDAGDRFTPLLTVLALYGGAARLLAMSADDPPRDDTGPDWSVVIDWYVENWEATELRRRTFKHTAESAPELLADTNPSLDTTDAV
jgi:hypothetical protein